MDPASTHLRAELVERRKTWKYWGGLLLAMFTQDAPPIFDLVVYRRESGAEVMRTVADIADPGHLLEQVKKDLRDGYYARWRRVPRVQRCRV